ncbi:MAG: 1-(5-phosphoribosyl)-5-[(5-phosphoribosylamino)methylideneamino] imidazole-4-carboxamide isomerase, partial [Ktedonobacterales bacterium]|nr:1-(5-phosphoribosyl)-5-[(5-phosphoribosylamino)methylideneamino] imidazole-4-carboxamide isomerase [Ktedonobacterales bacterium]
MGAMVLYPAIDLLGGQCVYMRRPADATPSHMVAEDAVAVARRWQEAGAEWLHVVDLDGAREGHLRQTEVIQAIAQATNLLIQVGGGVRGEEDVAAALEAGAARAVLGTTAARTPELLERCLARWGERMVVSVDARGDQVTVAEWLESATQTSVDFAWRMAQAGVRTLLVTDVERDGTLAPSDSPRLLRLREALPQVALIVGGGISSIAEVCRLAAADIDGVVLGRALYE